VWRTRPDQIRSARAASRFILFKEPLKFNAECLTDVP
jgi:hypothetical protein